jgi:hypothetical protein
MDFVNHEARIVFLEEEAIELRQILVEIGYKKAVNVSPAQKKATRATRKEGKPITAPKASEQAPLVDTDVKEGS